ncbi:MAG TPA: ferredoxin-type protein NapF [Hyphomicrobiales bacterium]|nr:ferredoxin-type protein NapF [Hyphomicrobiales bacterium]
MTIETRRRSLFDGFRGGSAPVRPPFALPDQEFVEVCERCGDCESVCRPNIVVRGRAGFPSIDFSRGACSFCGACADACRHGAFVDDRSGAPWQRVAAATTACLEAKGISCRLCESWCEPRAIRFRPTLTGSQMVVSPEACTGCGACVAPCPAGAIAIEDFTQGRGAA